MKQLLEWADETGDGYEAEVRLISGETLCAPLLRYDDTGVMLLPWNNRQTGTKQDSPRWVNYRHVMDARIVW